MSRSRKLASDDPRVQAAHQKYIAAYNRLTSLIQAGKGETVEGKKAYAEYVKARKEYNAIMARVQPPKKH